MGPPVGRRVVLFDGLCKLCNASVDFIIRRDREDRFRFATLQSQVGLELARRHRIPVARLSSVILVEGDEVYTRSTAALRILRALPGGYGLLYPLILVPPIIRDAVYGFIARHRYGWFGKRDSPRVPAEELRHKFLDDQDPA